MRYLLVVRGLATRVHFNSLRAAERHAQAIRKSAPWLAIVILDRMEVRV